MAAAGPPRWSPPATPPKWVHQADQRLPARNNTGDRTRGLVFDPDGRPLRIAPVISGQDRSLTSDLVLVGWEKSAASMISHVEAQVAAAMRRPAGDLPDEVVLVINNKVCRGPLSCTAMTASTLRPGQRLFIYERDPTGKLQGIPVVLDGTGERIAS